MRQGYGANTPVVLADGTQKNIEDLVIGDATLLGGYVTGHGCAVTPNLWLYKGVLVDGQVVVFQQNEDRGYRWLHVQDSLLAKKVDLGGNGSRVVHSVITQNNVLIIGGSDEIHGGNFVSCDVVEVVDAFKYSGPQRLQVLNSNNDRNRELIDIVTHFKVQMMMKKRKPKE